MSAPPHTEYARGRKRSSNEGSAVENKQKTPMIPGGRAWESRGRCIQSVGIEDSVFFLKIAKKILRFYPKINLTGSAWRE